MRTMVGVTVIWIISVFNLVHLHNLFKAYIYRNISKFINYNNLLYAEFYDGNIFLPMLHSEFRDHMDSHSAYKLFHS